MDCEPSTGREGIEHQVDSLGLHSFQQIEINIIHSQCRSFVQRRHTSAADADLASIRVNK